MRINEFYNKLELIKQKVLKDENEYLKLLKVIGNNQRYSFKNQLSIYDKNINAVACAKFDYWKKYYGRKVKEFEQGIPIIEEYKTHKKIEHIFNITQTVPINRDNDKIDIWNFNREVDENILKEMIISKGYIEHETLTKNIYLLSRIYIDKKMNILMNKLKIENNEDRISFIKFLNSSISYAISSRFNIDYTIDKEILKEKLLKLNSISLDLIGETVSYISKDVIDTTMKKSNEKVLAQNIEKEEILEYNKGSKELEEGEKHVFRGYTNGNDDGSNRIFGMREYGSDSGLNQREDIGQIGGGNGVHGEIPKSILRNNETRLLGGNSREGMFRPVSRFIRREEVNSSFDGRSRESDRVNENRRTENDESLELNRRDEEGKSTRVQTIDEQSSVSIEGDSNKGSSGSLKENNIINGEADEASFSLLENSYEQIGLTLTINQKDIDTVLINGGNNMGGRLPIIAEFSKGKSIEELGKYLKDTFQGGNGFYIDGKEVSSWYSNKGIHFAYGTSAREDTSQILNWNEAASRINKLLELGEFCTNVELLEAFDYERTVISKSLLNIIHDLSEKGKEQRLFEFLEITGGFQDKTEQLSEFLKNPYYLKDVISEYERFLEAYMEDKNILRFNYEVDNLHQKLKELSLTRKLYTSNLTELPKVKSFITDDEILKTILRGSGIDKGKERIIKFFGKNHTLQEKANFLKDEYGIGGSSSAVSGAMGSGESHNSKGIKLQKQDCNHVFLTWSNVAKYIDEMISKNLYIEEKKVDENKKEVKEPNYYSKDDPDNLMTDEMLEKVPKLYEQEDIPLSEKEVHAAYFIPFGSTSTWYMTEFDRETGNAFGLVLGFESEWGYFNINELKELKAQRLVLEDFPKTFRELKDTELVNQMTSEELAFVFNNQLVFEKDKEYELYDDLEEENIIDINLFEQKDEELEEKEIETINSADENNIDIDLLEVNHQEEKLEQKVLDINAIEDVREKIAESNIKVKNFKIKKETLPEKLTPSERLNYNLDAIKLLKSIENGEKTLNLSVQEVLSKYVGWGGLSEVFDESKEGQWKEARIFLKENLSESEYEAARESTLTSFYTPKIIIDTIYNTLSDMGFKSGNILEPSMGVGSFIGSLPDNMTSSKFYGVELDTLSGRIGKLLYPESNIEIKGFEETNFSNNFFDIAIGNVPFGDYKINDREYNKNNFLIHDYFFAKAIDKVRNGGIIAFITSSGTMDKKDESVRKYISLRAEFLGAIRLPNNTFRGVAGTEVTSDIIFLKKRDSIREYNDDWIHLSEDEKGLTYNKYFVDNPEMILGNMKEVSGRFGNTLACLPIENVDLNNLLMYASKKIYSTAKYEEIELIEEEITSIKATDDVKNFSYTIIDNEVYYRENSLFIKKEMYDKNKEIVKNYLKVTEALKELIYKQKEDFSDEEVKLSQEKLNEVYDYFSKKHGFINSSSNTKVLREDSNFPLVSSIEIIDKDEKFKGKADIFTKRTIRKAMAVNHVDTSIEALVLSVSQRGSVDFDYMSSLTDKDKPTLIEELKGEIFLNIRKKENSKGLISFNIENEDLPFTFTREINTNKYYYVTKDEYLSGNIREKIAIVDSYLKRLIETENNLLNIGYSRDGEEQELLTYEINSLKYQKEELSKILPKKLEASEISVKLGATWISTDYIKDFIFEILKTPYFARNYITVEFSPLTSEWNISGKSIDNRNDLANMTYGTSRISAYKLIEEALNLKEPRVFDQIINDDGTKTYVLNKKETMIAVQKQEILKEEFKNWIFSYKARRDHLVELYNEKFNSIRNREYDGSNLTFEGMNTEITLRTHQKNAIARSLYGGNTLLAHVVGSGKTFEMVASAMEAKRLGMCTKSLFVVPNHLTRQIGREFMQLYPSANIMIADKKDFEPKRRKRFIGKIATGEYDAVIIGHTQFEKIPMSKEYQIKHIQGQIDEIIAHIKGVKNERNQNFTVKQLEKSRKRLETRLEKLNDDFKKDDVITFEELGVDKLFVDEAHSYKNLYLHTKMRNVAGIGQSEAFKSSDMFMKCRYMDEITGGKGVVFATGTPVSNSMTEIYTMQRYLQYEALKNFGHEHFDSWAAHYGETISSLELAPEGTGYRIKTRFSKFYNLPELMALFKEIADIQTADMINLPTPKANYEVIKTLPSEEQKEILKSLSERADDVRNRVVDSSIDNMLKITNDGKKLALDQRLINPLLPDNPDSKVNTCINKVFSIWNETKESKSTQLIFSDLSTPKGDGEFNVYDDIREKLVLRGVPREEIAFIHEANSDKQKDKLFDKVRNGEVRILLGSTQKMGAGTNVQNKLIALHDLDVPWRPADLEQRAGRIVRQGNENKEVYVYRYVTENTFDSYLWQTIENKQKFISQIMTSKTPVRAMEDVDENTLNYAEIKALATGNPQIKEKMDLDNEVTKLKILEANYKSNKYKLEDKVFKTYPEEIKNTENLIEAMKKDILMVEPKANNEEKFNSIIINRIRITDKKLAGEVLIETIKKMKIKEGKVIGKYRNMDLEVKFSFIDNGYKFSLNGSTKHYGELGKSAEGNILRFDNVIDKMPSNLKRLEEKLITTKEMLDNAKEELKKPFEKAEELKSKILRLAELNQILDMGESEEEMNNNKLFAEVKRAIIDFCNREYEKNNSYEDFDKLYPDLKHIGLAYTNTPDEKYEIQYEINLEDKIWIQYVNNIKISSGSFNYENNGEVNPLRNMKEEIEASSFDDLVSVNLKDLKEKLGLEIDDDGNFYDPLKEDFRKDSVNMLSEEKKKEIWKKIYEHEEWIRTKGLKGKQLNLEDENLAGMRLLNVDLRDSNFKNADLRECIIFADLRGADLTGVKLENTKWTGSNINRITIEANKLNLIEYQLKQEADIHSNQMRFLKTNEKEMSMRM